MGMNNKAIIEEIEELNAKEKQIQINLIWHRARFKRERELLETDNTFEIHNAEYRMGLQAELSEVQARKKYLEQLLTTEEPEIID